MLPVNRERDFHRNHSLLPFEYFKSLEFPYPLRAPYSNAPLKGAPTWEKYIKLAKKFAKFDFGCDFKNGLCRAERETGKPKWETSKEDLGKGCCSNCANQKGYLDSIPTGTAAIYAKLFNSKLGFWRPNKGCTLPHHLRSITCLRYNCYATDKKLLIQIQKASPYAN